jgi:hypothetical protein
MTALRITHIIVVKGDSLRFTKEGTVQRVDLGKIPGGGT